MRYDQETRKKQNLVRLVLCVFMGLVGILALGLCFSVQAQVTCGQTIGGHGETVTLKDDLMCQKDEPGLTVKGPATLNLNGHTVSHLGTLSKTGISVTGQGAQIVNGTVTGWDTAVYVTTDVTGGGHHKIVHLKIENNNTGIYVRYANENDVINNFVKDNLSRGIRVRQSYGNELINNYVENSAKGIRIDDNSASNTIVSNTLVANNVENCDIKGNNNLIVHNIAKNGAEECFVIGDLEDQKIQTNGNRLVNNTAFNCKTGGFVASLGSHDNYIGHNTAHCNLEDCLDIPDLQDRHPTCGANTWFKNVADSASPECILR